MIALVGGSVGAMLWVMLHKLGIGVPGGKPNCGCGSGLKCRTKESKR